MKILSEIKKISIGKVNCYGITCGIVGPASHMAYLRIDSELREKGDMRASVGRSIRNNALVMIKEDIKDINGLIYATDIEPAKHGELQYLNLTELVTSDCVTILEQGRTVYPEANFKFRGADQYILMVRKSCVLYYKRNGVDNEKCHAIVFDVEKETVTTLVSKHTVTMYK